MRATIFFMLLACTGTAQGAEDIVGSRDPLALARFPHSWIVDYQTDDEPLPREFIIGRVDKTRRAVRAERKVRTEARIESAIYEMPSGTPRQDVADHYAAQLGGHTLFVCQGRDCGRSNEWANDIFGRAILYGPDSNQWYLAVDRDGDLVSVYVIERGNKRVYAYVLAVKPLEPVTLDANRALSQQLAGKGFALVDGVVPLADGGLTESAARSLAALAPGLHDFAGQRLYVVCHIYGTGATEQLLQAAERCSVRAASLLRTSGGPEFVPFAAGPLLPRPSAGASRIELVLPRRLDPR